VDRLELVEVIEVQKARLSPNGKELWEELDILVYMTPEEEQIQKQQEDIAERMSYLPLYDQGVIKVLTEVRGGLYASDKKEVTGESGEVVRVQAVLRAANIKNIAEGRQADPDMTLEQAIAQLREGSESL
jgi:hypothetical protein